MESIKLSHAGKIITIPPPNHIDELITISKSQFGVSRPSFKYLDEDNELITVQTQLEFEEALIWVMELNTVIQVEELGTLGQSRSSQFIDELPLLRSQITNEPFSGSIEESVVIEEMKMDRSNSPVNNFIDKCTEMKKVDAENQIGNNTKVDLGIGTKYINLVEIACGRDKIDHEMSTNIVEAIDKSCEPIALAMDAKQTGPELVDNGQNTEIKTHQETTMEIVHASSRDSVSIPVITNPIAIQCDKASFEKQLRLLVREEISKVGSLRLSQISHCGTQCKACGVKPIFGIRYKCTSCQDFNLCENCEDMTEHEHNLLKLKRPEEIRKTETDVLIERIKGMGFYDEEKVRKLLMKNHNNLDETVSALLE